MKNYADNNLWANTLIVNWLNTKEKGGGTYQKQNRRECPFCFLLIFYKYFVRITP